MRFVLAPALALLLAAVAVAAAPAPAVAQSADAGALRATLDGDRAVLTDATGETVVVARPVQAVAPAGEGVIALRAAGPVTFADGSRLFGTGSRSDAVDRRGRSTEAYVCDGPFRLEDRLYPRALVPPWASCERDDATYFPIPWVLSAKGYGVLADHDERVTIRSSPGEFTVSAEAPALGLRVFGGPAPADALRRFTRDTGRQPAPPQPWTYGPWVQTGQPNVVPLAEEKAIVSALQQADAPVSAAETQMHFLPCGAHEADPAYNRARTEQFHRLGLAHLVYLNPLLCTSYSRLWREAAARGALQRERATGLPHIYPAFVGGAAPLGFSAEPLSQFDFSAPAARDLYARMVKTIRDGGHDGWMEDFGESTSPTVMAADDTPGQRLHNRYPTDYHCAVAQLAPQAVRFSRSGWTGTARCTVNVWGGDPTTVWGYDGLASAVKQALSIGLSGVSRFATDIGGYNTFGPRENLTGELLDRWIQVGALLPVMRTKRSGLAFPPYDRPQVFDPEHLPMWQRYARLHTRLYPYLVAADASYRGSGMPIVRHLLLAAPGEPQLWDQEDVYGFGPDLLVAPVLAPGQDARTLRAPRGRWIDLWRSVSPALELGPARLAPGGELTLPAPRDELPLLVRAGAVLPLLAADVDTLSPYQPQRADVIRLADRLDRLTLLAWPRGRSSARVYEDERVDSTETRRGWTLRTRFRTHRAVSLEASLQALRRPFKPCAVTLANRRRKFRYDRATGVLRVNFRARRRATTLRALRCAPRAQAPSR